MNSIYGSICQRLALFGVAWWNNRRNSERTYSVLVVFQRIVLLTIKSTDTSPIGHTTFECIQTREEPVNHIQCQVIWFEFLTCCLSAFVTNWIKTFSVWMLNRVIILPLFCLRFINMNCLDALDFPSLSLSVFINDSASCKLSSCYPMWTKCRESSVICTQRTCTCRV